ncbi:MAG: DUF4393 domain-containing protein [Acidimicrobiales bacterium]|nr:DUF4393 domain-containing protein [Acidimicrobiales bacterium]
MADERPSDDPATEALPDLDAILAAAPGLARIAGNAAAHLAEWAINSTVDNGVATARALRDGEPTAKVVGDAWRRVLDQTGDLLPTRDDHPEPSADRPEAGSEDDLRQRGASLLRRSADVDHEESAHPAYARIIDELAPDEARLLRAFYQEGPQPSVDVRAAGALPISSELVAPGITMVGSIAGCRYLDRVPRYLNNLQRLGLIWFSREAVDDVAEYQVLEAQPDVVAALADGKRTKTVRRSIHLTPFGIDFCEVCLPVGER